MLNRQPAAGIAAVILISLFHAASAVPDGIDYQGYLTNADGTAVDTVVSMQVTAFNVDVGGAPLWGDSFSVEVNQGLFTVALGSAVNPLPAGLFDSTVFLEIVVEGETLTPRRSLTSTAFSFKASDADTLTGVSAGALDQSGDVAGLQTDVGTNDSRITALEATGADITGVSAGTGLAGGGTSGDVSLGVAADGIDASMLAPNSVTTDALAPSAVTGFNIAAGTIDRPSLVPNIINSNYIQDGQIFTEDLADNSVNAAKLSPFQSYQMAALQIADSGSPTGVRITAFQGAIQWGPVGTNEIQLSSPASGDLFLFDNTRSRAVLDWDADGLALANSAPPGPAFDVAARTLEVKENLFVGTTVQATSVLSDGVIATGDVSATNVTATGDVTANGNFMAGLERVQVEVAVDNQITSCHSHGNLQCYTGANTVTCPAGKKAVGGGVFGFSARFGSVSRSYPSNDLISWTCEVSYDIQGTTTCYAICARIQ